MRMIRQQAFIRILQILNEPSNLLKKSEAMFHSRLTITVEILVTSAVFSILIAEKL